MQALDYNAFLLSASFVFCSFTVNPFIYAARYKVFRRYLKQMMNKNNTGWTANWTQLTITHYEILDSV